MIANQLRLLFQTESEVDRYCKELKIYHDRVRHQVEIRIAVFGIITGIILGVFGFYLIFAGLETFVPEGFAKSKYLIFIAVFLLSNALAGFGIHEDIYGWASKNKLTSHLEALCRGFGEAKAFELDQLTEEIVRPTGLSAISVIFNNTLHKVVFKCSTTGLVVGYVVVVSFISAALTLGLLYQMTDGG